MVVLPTETQLNTNWPKVNGTYKQFKAWGTAASWRITNTAKLLFVVLDESCEVPEGIERGMVSMSYAPTYINEDACPVGTSVNLTLIKPANKRFSDAIAEFVSIRESEIDTPSPSSIKLAEPLKEISNTLPVVIPLPTIQKEKMIITGVDKKIKCNFVGRCIALQKDKATAIEEAMQLWLELH